MKVKKYIGTLLTLSLLAILSACQYNKVIEINSIDGLYAMESNKNYILTTDLDLENREWYPLNVKNFDGNNHTISNFYSMEITGDNLGSYAGFLGQAESVKNLNLTNVEIKASFIDNGSYGGIVVGKTNSLENVSINNCQASFTCQKNTSFSYIGGMAGYVFDATNNCHLNDVNLTLTSFATKGRDAVGGLVGKISNGGIDLSCENLDITTNTCQNLDLGGLVGQAYYDFSKVKATNITIDISNSTKFKEISAGGLLGDISGSDSNLSYFNGENIEMNIDNKATKNYIGGLAGFSSGYTINYGTLNNLEINSTNSTDDYDLISYVAGLAPTTNKTVNQVVLSNIFLHNGYEKKTDNIFTAGLVCKANASLINSAIFNVAIPALGDSFTMASSLINNCYIGKYTGTNVNSLPIITDEDWPLIISILGLNEDIFYWNNSILKVRF